MKRNQKGFTLIELVITIGVMVILMGVLVPSLKVLFGFEAQKATEKMKTALSKTKVEAMNRIVGEMKLEYQEDGYYLTYYLDRGKESRNQSSLADQTVQIASSKVLISYKLSGESQAINMKEAGNSSLILTYNRENGGFRQVQTDVVTPQEVQDALANSRNVSFHDSGQYCEWIRIQCGMRTRTIVFQPESGTYMIQTN